MFTPRFIFVGEGKIGELFWVEIDGNAESVNPSRLKELIPEVATASELEGSEFACAATVDARSTIRAALNKASAVIADSDAVCRIYTLDSGIQACVLERAKSFLAAV